MNLLFLDNWLFFVILYGLMLLVSFIMSRQSRQFYTQDPIRRKFSIMELELPATPRELVNLIKGLYALPPTDSEKSIAALKNQLLVDFFFMPLAYGCIALLGYRVANKMQLNFAYYVFIFFALVQIVPWVLDFIENVFLLRQLRPDVTEADEKTHRRYLRMEAVKWGVALFSVVCCVSAICYFWLTGNYSSESFWYMVVFLVETVAFLIAVKVSS